MHGKSQTFDGRRHSTSQAGPLLRRWIVGGAVAWTAIVGVCLAWTLNNEWQHTFEIARTHAQVAHAKDMDFRHWIARKGGVFVPITANTLPNPYLNVAERDIETPGGLALTLMNPAYATRQVHELALQHRGVRGHLTSLKPLNPDNAPDAWERRALAAFADGAEEVAEVREIDGAPHMRLMRPLPVEESCLGCHGHQGYAVGEVRGGISAAIPLTPLLAKATMRSWVAAGMFGLLWLLGLTGLGFAGRHVRLRIEQRDRAEASLREARDAAEAATQAKSVFLANMSHELRTPLTAILGYTEMLNSGDADIAERANAATTIQRNGQHLLQVINDVLDLSKIEAGRFEVESVPCEPGAIVHECAELLRPRAEAQGLRLEVGADGALPVQIRTDPLRLKQAVLNLLSNALKFSEEGVVRVTCGCDATARTLSIAVQDEGIGMSAAQRAKLFTPFTQVDGSTTRRYGGSGLGLAITRQIAELLGGGVAVESAVGRGSTFTLTIATGPLEGVAFEPLRERSADRVRVVVDPDAAPASSLLRARILLVEDGEDNARLFSAILRKAGALVERARDGREGLEFAFEAVAEGAPFDVILMDMQMPLLDGAEATRELRGRGYSGEIIGLSAHAMRGEREKALAAGCNDYLAKPISRERLLHEVSEALRRSRELVAPARV